MVGFLGRRGVAPALLALLAPLGWTALLASADPASAQGRRAIGPERRAEVRERLRRRLTEPRPPPPRTPRGEHADPYTDDLDEPRPGGAPYAAYEEAYEPYDPTLEPGEDPREEPAAEAWSGTAAEPVPEAEPALHRASRTELSPLGPAATEPETRAGEAGEEAWDDGAPEAPERALPPWLLQLSQYADDERLAPLREVLDRAIVIAGRARRGELGPREQRLLATAALVLLGGPFLLGVVIPLLRGRGDLAVDLAYPDELRGEFRVRVSTRRSRRRSARRPGGGAVSLGDERAASRFDHPSVSRETRFRKLRARTWWVSVEGVLRDPDNDESLETRFAEERVRVRRGRTARLSLDFRPEECPVDVKVLWDKRPVRDARVAVHGVPGSERYARGGTVRLKLGPGRHVLVVGSGDRVAQHPVEVASYRATWVVLDLAGSEVELLFKGCPPAVEPYVQGDYPAAARALEREGQTRVARLLLARLDREQGRDERAAAHYEAAECWLEAAELRAGLAQHAAAAALYEKAGAPARAAEAYRMAGDLAAAGRAWETAEDWDSAVACFRECGDRASLTGALERRGSYFEAAELALEGSDWNRAIRDLQHVAPGNPRYTDACRLLGRAYQQIGETDLAIQKLEEVVRSRGAEAPLDLQRSLAEALEHTGQAERALSVYRDILLRDPDHPNVQTRVESLRKQVSSQRLATVSHPGPGGGGGGGRYEILEELGRGGMGVVYRARDRRLGREVALKRLPENLRDHPKAVELFLREARAAAALNHPNIVTLFDADEDDGHFFITMELLRGQNLYAILRRVGRAKPRDVARLCVQVCAGLDYAHESGIVHRDVKTANLFFTHDKVVKVMDFGLAKMTEEVRKSTTVVAGTPYYMAPEQSAGAQVDRRADVYALGVTLFELATGTLPFEEGDVAFHHRSTPAPDPRSRVPDLPAPLAELILHCMAKRPDGRPPTAAAVGNALQQLLGSR